MKRKRKKKARSRNKVVNSVPHFTIITTNRYNEQISPFRVINQPDSGIPLKFIPAVTACTIKNFSVSFLLHLLVSILLSIILHLQFLSSLFSLLSPFLFFIILLTRPVLLITWIVGKSTLQLILVLELRMFSWAGLLHWM